MPRTHGYSLKGERCYGEHDWHSRGRVNVLGALHQQELLTVTLIEGTINTDVFYSWVSQELVQSIPAKSVVVLDNATFHKRETIRTAIEERGHVLEFLPSYSPDLNPIEHKWSQAKARRRRYRCSVTELFAQWRT